MEARWSWPSLLASNIRLKEVRLVLADDSSRPHGPARVQLLRPSRPDPPADPKAKPSRWKFHDEKLGLVLGNIVLRDEAVSPPATWRIRG